jgi:hypothetical protein
MAGFILHALPRLLLFSLLAAAPSAAQTADSLPAFRPDSAVQDPFRKVEAGPSVWSSHPSAADSAAKPKTGLDSAQTDSLSSKLRSRHPAISFYAGIDFIDLDAKAGLGAQLLARTDRDSLQVLQNYDPVHLAFPLGFQAIFPLGAYLDAVAKTHSYWYKQTAILGDKDLRHAGDEWFSLQANLGGLGLRYYIPPSLLSVTGGLGLYAQAVLYWNLGGTEMDTRYGTAPANFELSGSGYEIQFGLQKPLSGRLQLSGSLGFLQQDFQSDRPWSDILIFNPPAGKVHWASSAIQASLHLGYNFGIPK